MVSKEEYLAFVREVTKKDVDNENLNNLILGRNIKNVFGFIFGILNCFFGISAIFLLGLFGIAFIFFGVFLCIFYGAKLGLSSKAREYYKSNYISQILDFLLSDYNYEYDKTGEIDQKVFESSCFGGDYDDYNGEDKLTINIPSNDGKMYSKLILCDLDVTKTEEDDEGNKKTVTVYSGVFGYIDFPFEFKCTLCLNTWYAKGKKKLEKVVLEDINFSKKYKVYSDDQIESRCILTPDMMNKLMDLRKKIGLCEFTLVNNRMYVGLESLDLFEINNYKEGKIESLFEHLYDEVAGIISIVNEIENNDKVFKM